MSTCRDDERCDVFPAHDIVEIRSLANHGLNIPTEVFGALNVEKNILSNEPDTKEEQFRKVSS